MRVDTAKREKSVDKMLQKLQQELVYVLLSTVETHMSTLLCIHKSLKAIRGRDIRRNIIRGHLGEQIAYLAQNNS